MTINTNNTDSIHQNDTAFFHSFVLLLLLLLKLVRDDEKKKLDCSIQIGHCIIVNTEFLSKKDLTTYFNYIQDIRLFVCFYFVQIV